MKKKSFLLTAVLSLFFVGIFNSTSVNAQGTASSEDAFYSPEFDGYVVPFKQKDNGQMEALTKEEHDQIIEQQQSLESDDVVLENKISNSDQDNKVTPMGYREYYKFVHTSSKNYTGNPIKVSPDIGCTVKKGCSLGHNQTYSTNISVTYGSANGAQKSAIKSSLGINFTKVEATTNSFTFNLAKGQKGYVAFKPYKVKKSGYYKLCGNQGTGCRKTNKKGYARIPRKLSNGYANGMFYFVLKKKK